MVGSKRLHQLITAADKANARIVLIGDYKQLQAIEAGRIFYDLQKAGVMRTVEMKEVLRQKTQYMKNTVSSVSERRLDKAFSILEKNRKINQVSDRDDRISAIVDDYTNKYDYKDTVVLTGLNLDRNEINSRIRQELISQGKLTGPQYTFLIRESKSINAVERYFSQSYGRGDVIVALDDIKDLKKVPGRSLPILISLPIVL